MMFNKKSTIILVILVLLLAPKSFTFAEKNTNEALIIYESELDINSVENKVDYLNELLYVFNKNVEKMQVDDYKSGDIESYNSVFVININNDIGNKEFLEDLSSYKNNIYWIGDKIEDFLRENKKYKIKYNYQNNSINKLIYKEDSLVINSGNSFNIINPSKKSKTLAYMSDSYNTYPFIINEDNLYYISRWDLQDSFIFEDSLNDFYNIKEFDKEKIFVRIEDVHPFRDTTKLREIADYLYSKDIPFMIALIPTYTDSKTQAITTMDMMPEFIETIQYMQEKGGSIVLHGYTHQLGKEEISGEGYEFWDIKNDEPIDEDIEPYVKNRVLSGLRLCIENDIYPLAYEAPHYAINIDGYKELKKYFSTYVGQYQNNNNNFTTNASPFIIKNSDTFNVLIPENLDYVDEDNDFAVDIIKENFKKLSMVRGHTGGFLFHSYLDINYLKEIVKFLEDENVEFLDLKEEYNYVKVDDIRIVSDGGEIHCTYDKSKAISSNKEKSKFEMTIENINNVVIIFVTVILILFIIIFIVFRIINTRKFTRR